MTQVLYAAFVMSFEVLLLRIIALERMNDHMTIDNTAVISCNIIVIVV